MAEFLLAMVCGSGVGLALGLTGGGGSIFAVPLLIYVLHLPPAAAVPVSLFAVALTAMTGAVLSARQRLAVWPAAAAFGLGGVIGAPVGVALSRRLDEQMLVLGFACLALAVGISMWWRSLSRPAEATAVRAMPAEVDAGGACRMADDGRLRFTAPCALVLTAAGLGTGFLSGIFGVGGGFLIVPTMAAVSRMGIHRAVATSLVALTLIGLAGTVGVVLQGSLAWAVLLPFVAGGAAGMGGGRMLALRLAGPTLQRTFATAIVLVALVMATDALRT